jgi:hypothetical protein
MLGQGDKTRQTDPARQLLFSSRRSKIYFIQINNLKDTAALAPQCAKRRSRQPS